MDPGSIGRFRGLSPDPCYNEWRAAAKAVARKLRRKAQPYVLEGEVRDGRERGEEGGNRGVGSEGDIGGAKGRAWVARGGNSNSNKCVGGRKDQPCRPPGCTEVD